MAVENHHAVDSADQLASETTFSHYDSFPMEYIAIFHCCENDTFQMQKCDIFLVFAQNVDCGYMLERPR